MMSVDEGLSTFNRRECRLLKIAIHYLKELENLNNSIHKYQGLSRVDINALDSWVDNCFCLGENDDRRIRRLNYLQQALIDISNNDYFLAYSLQQVYGKKIFRRHLNIHNSWLHHLTCYTSLLLLRNKLLKKLNGLVLSIPRSSLSPLI